MYQFHVSEDQTQAAFRALADPTRRQILCQLAESDMTIGDIVDGFDITRGAIKKHLVKLEEGGLISVRTQGRERINRLEPLGLNSVTDWLNHFHEVWNSNLSALKIAAEQAEQTKTQQDQTQ
jgi:DNA-binding transcriptional ArsR family regulator